MAESEGGKSAKEPDGSAQAPPRTSSSLNDDVESPVQVVPANVGDRTLSPEQFARYFKEMEFGGVNFRLRSLLGTYTNY